MATSAHFGQVQKNPCGIYSQDKVSQPYLYFKGSEGVFAGMMAIAFYDYDRRQMSTTQW